MFSDSSYDYQNAIYEHHITIIAVCSYLCTVLVPAPGREEDEERRRVFGMRATESDLSKLCTEMTELEPFVILVPGPKTALYRRHLSCC